MNRELGTEILVSSATLAAVKGRVRVRERGAVNVKGKAEPVELFELLDTGEPGGSRWPVSSPCWSSSLPPESRRRSRPRPSACSPRSRPATVAPGPEADV